MEVERVLPRKTRHFIFPSSVYEKIPFPTILPAINLNSLFKCFAILMRLKKFLIVNLILFMYLLTTWLCSDMKFLFMFLPVVFSWIIFLYFWAFSVIKILTLFLSSELQIFFYTRFLSFFNLKKFVTVGIEYYMVYLSDSTFI